MQRKYDQCGDVECSEGDGGDGSDEGDGREVIKVMEVMEVIGENGWRMGKEHKPQLFVAQLQKNAESAEYTENANAEN